MHTRRIVGWTAAVVALLAALLTAWVGWLGWQAQVGPPRRAGRGHELRSALAAVDRPGAQAAGKAMASHARSAVDHTDGWAWTVATWVPVVGDDATGVRAVSRSLLTLATEGVAGDKNSVVGSACDSNS